MIVFPINNPVNGGKETYDFYPCVEESIAEAEGVVEEIVNFQFLLAKSGLAEEAVKRGELPATREEACDRMISCLNQGFTDLFLQKIIEAYQTPNDTNKPITELQ